MWDGSIVGKNLEEMSLYDVSVNCGRPREHTFFRILAYMANCNKMRILTGRSAFMPKRAFVMGSSS